MLRPLLGAPACVGEGVDDPHIPRQKGKGMRLGLVLRVLLGLMWVQARAESPWVSVWASFLTSSAPSQFFSRLKT